MAVPCAVTIRLLVVASLISPPLLIVMDVGCSNVKVSKPRPNSKTPDMSHVCMVPLKVARGIVTLIPAGMVRLVMLPVGMMPPVQVAAVKYGPDWAAVKEVGVGPVGAVVDPPDEVVLVDGAAVVLFVPDNDASSKPDGSL